MDKQGFWLRNCESGMEYKMSAIDILYFPIAENRVFRSKGQAARKKRNFSFVILLTVCGITPFLNFL